jgi:hypothetical protein
MTISISYADAFFDGSGPSPIVPFGKTAPERAHLLQNIRGAQELLGA